MVPLVIPRELCENHIHRRLVADHTIENDNWLTLMRHHVWPFARWDPCPRIACPQSQRSPGTDHLRWFDEQIAVIVGLGICRGNFAFYSLWYVHFAPDSVSVHCETSGMYTNNSLECLVSLPMHLTERLVWLCWPDLSICNMNGKRFVIEKKIVCAGACATYHISRVDAAKERHVVFGSLVVCNWFFRERWPQLLVVLLWSFYFVHCIVHRPIPKQPYTFYHGMVLVRRPHDTDASTAREINKKIVEIFDAKNTKQT